MKKLLVILSFACALVACQQDNPNNYPIGAVPPEYTLLVLKFPNSDYMDNVVAMQHVISFNYDKMNYNYQDDDSTSLFLYRNYCYNEELFDFIHRKTTLEGSIPYLPLIDDWYLIDWKWYNFYPLTFYDCNAYPDEAPYIIEEYSRYSYLTDTKWEDLTYIADTFDIADCSVNLEGVKAMVVPLRLLDRLYGEEKSHLYHEYNMRGVLGHYNKYDRNDTIEGTSYLSLIQSFDSIHNVNRQRLIEVMRSGKIKEIAYQ